MSSVRRIRASGSLATDPSALDQSENLSVARNVAMHRPGIVMPRPGFGDTTGTVTRAFASFVVSGQDDGVSATYVVPIVEFGAYVPQVGWTLTDEVPTARTITNVVTGATNYTLTLSGTIDTTDDITVSAGSTGYRPISMAAYGGDLVVQSYDGTNYRIERASALTTYSGSSARAAPHTSRGVSAWMKARGALYWTTGGQGIRKITSISAGASSDVRAGLPTAYIEPSSTPVQSATASSDTAAVNSGSSVGYRYVFRRDSTYTIRSAPSARWIVPADAGTYPNGAYTEAGQIFLPPEIVAGDFVELYRTVNSGSATSDPGEDYYLVGTYEVTSTDVTNNYTVAVSFTDQLPDAQLGAALYTSASPFGISAAKELPPSAAHLVQWKRCAWAGNTRVRAATTMTIVKVAYQSGATTKLEGTGLTYVNSGSYTGVAGNALTGVTFASGLDWASLVAGSVMWIADNEDPTATVGRINANSRIVSFNQGAGTITLSSAPSGTGAFRAGDIVTLDQDGVQTEFFASSTTDYTTRRFVIPLTTSDSSDRCELTAASLARVLSEYTAAELGSLHIYAINDQDLLALQNGAGGDGGMILVVDRPENTTFGFMCEARPTAFAELAADGTHQALTDEVAGRVQWSDPDEPESWPLGNSVTIGDRNADVLALVPLERCLLVFKEDGIYSIQGDPPNNWVVREFDLAKRHLAPQAVCVLDDVCYAWTDRGVCAVTEASARAVSMPIGNTLRPLQQYLPLNDNNTKRGFWMEAHPRLGAVILGTGGSASATTATAEYVFFVNTGRWCSWNQAWRCVAYDQAEDRLAVVPTLDAAWEVVYERSAEATSTSYRDHSVSKLEATISGTSVTIAIADFGPFTPVAGDVLVDTDGDARSISSVASGGGNYTLTVLTGMAGSTVDWHQAYACTLIWQAQHLPGLGLRWQEIHVALQESDSAYLTTWPMLVGGTAVASVSMATDWVTCSVPESLETGGIVRVGPPRSIVRNARLSPLVIVTTAGVLWQLSELALHHSMQSRRVSR